MATRKKSNGFGRFTKKLAKVAVVLLLFAGSGWWLFASNSDNKVRKTVLGRLSLFVDRMDEVSQVWKERQVPGTSSEKPAGEDKPAAKQTPKKKTATASKPATKPEPAPEPQPAAKPEPTSAPIKPAPQPTTTSPKTTAPAKTSKPASPPASDVSREDQEQLEDFFKQLK